MTTRGTTKYLQAQVERLDEKIINMEKAHAASYAEQRKIIDTREEDILSLKLQLQRARDDLKHQLQKTRIERDALFATPIPMRLHCPECKTLHIDEGEFATKPHHTHACQECGAVWRPARVATVGVRFLPGFKNGEAAPSEPTFSGIVKIKDADGSLTLFEAAARKRATFEMSSADHGLYQLVRVAYWDFANRKLLRTL